MPQFDVYALTDGSLVVDVQSDFVRVYGTRLVVPLVEPDADAAETSRLNPVMRVDGRELLLATQLAGAIREKHLHYPLTSLANDDYTIKRALDMLISGF